MKNTGPRDKSERAPILWMHEAIKYLGLDRLGLARPDLSMHRLIRKGAVHPKKIAGHFIFNKKELDTLIANEGQKRGRGYLQRRLYEKCARKHRLASYRKSGKKDRMSAPQSTNGIPTAISNGECRT